MADAQEFEDALNTHVLDAWFPRSLDHEYGGFLCDYDRAWNFCGPNEKLLEFQARHTLAAAEALRVYPDNQRLRDASLHGLRCLRNVMWDPDSGGWFHLTDRAGRPLESHTKHSHGFAYAIQACAAVYAVTGEPDALKLAQEGFEWMDRYARDHENGGYFGFLKRDGTVIRRASDCPWEAECDTVGTEFGLKDLNVHSDLVETFVYLYRVWPDATVGARLAEIVDVVTDKMIAPGTGAMHFFVTPDWRPIPHLIRAGYQCHTAFRILLAVGMTGDANHLRTIARRILDHAMRYVVDPEIGGYFYAAPGSLPTTLHGQFLPVRHKAWWVQMEALKALMAVSRMAPDDPRYLAGFETQWRYIKRHFLDPRYGGIYSAGLDLVAVWQRKLGARLAPAAITRKGDVWKDASHECRALLYCVEALRGTPG
jgi:mannose/cellobiose epimerase-like protein (N-acyl-D-glucosamine 2-epimerase family)